MGMAYATLQASGRSFNLLVLYYKFLKFNKNNKISGALILFTINIKYYFFLLLLLCFLLLPCSASLSLFSNDFCIPLRRFSIFSIDCEVLSSKDPILSSIPRSRSLTLADSFLILALMTLADNPGLFSLSACLLMIFPLSFLSLFSLPAYWSCSRKVSSYSLVSVSITSPQSSLDDPGLLVLFILFQKKFEQGCLSCVNIH